MSKEYIYFFEFSTSYKGSRVGLCIKPHIADYVFYHYGNHGRYIYIDLQLKNKVKLRIFNIYLHANNTHIHQRLVLEKEILDHIQQAHHYQFRIIIMRNFNIDIDNLHINRQYHMLKLNFIQQLAVLDMYDCYNLVHKDTILKAHMTWSHPT